MYELLKHNLKKYISVSDEELEKFCQLFEEKSIKKKEFLLREGEICSFEAFIVKELLKLQ